MSSADHTTTDAPNETAIRRKIFRKHLFNHQRRDLEAEFTEYQKQIGSVERRTDLERYVLVALAIGRTPNDPPQWALDECEKLYVRDASHQSSVTERVKDFEPDEALLEVVITILEAHSDNLAAFFSHNEDGGDFLPEETTPSFKKHTPGPAAGQTPQAEDEADTDPSMSLVDTRLSTTAAMRDVLSRNGETVLHDDAKLKLLQRRWRQTSRQDKQALLWRAFHIAQFRRSGHVPRFRYSE